MSKANYISLTNKEIRSYSRERLLGNMTVPVFATILIAFAKYLFNFCREFGILGGSIPAVIFYLVLTIVVSTFWGIFKYGLYRFYITLVTKKEARFTCLFDGFRNSTETVLTVSLVLSLVNFICFLPYYLYSFFFAPNTVMGILISIAAFAICTLLYDLVSIVFVPIYFLICDHPGMPFPILIILNFSMMSFKKWFKFLRLQISFIPLLLLSFLSFGIGFLWVLPYVFTSYTYFYEDLCEEYCASKAENKEASND